MKTYLCLPKIDAQIERFILSCPASETEAPPKKMGIVYLGRVYREIVCSGFWEMEQVDRFLVETGYVNRLDPANSKYDRLYELID